MATLALILALRHRRMNQKKIGDPRRSMLFNSRYNKDVGEPDGKHWDEARRMCNSIMAGKHIAGKQTIGTIISD